MATVVLTIVVVLIAVLALSAGALVGSRTIKGSGGGMSSVPGATCASCFGHCDYNGDDRASSDDPPREAVAGEDRVPGGTGSTQDFCQ